MRLMKVTAILGLTLVGAGHGLACTNDYHVKRGDTLSTIARAELGSVFDYQRIFDANRHKIGWNPNRIQPGMVLSIPCQDVAVGDIDWSVMPNADALASMLNQSHIQVLDIRERDQIAGGFIPGAVWVPYPQWRGPAENQGEPPSPEKLAKIIGEAGLRLDRPIAIIHDRATPMDTGRGAIVYWLLKSSGASQLAILRGGMSAWDDAGLPVSNQVARPEPYVPQVSFSTEWRADEVDVYGIATGQIDGLLLDARPHDMFERFDTLGRALASTIPTARSLPAPPLLSVLRGEVHIESGVQTVIDYFNDKNADGTGGPVITFCQVGELGALNWFYASELAQLENIKLYPESIQGWTQAGGQLFVGWN